MDEIADETADENIEESMNETGVTPGSHAPAPACASPTV
jgi:hypothetical protein